MLSRAEFDRVTVVIVENIHYEVIRTRNHPMIMFDGDNGTPIAAVRFHSDAESSFISARPDNDQSNGKGGRFQGVTNESGLPFAFIVTNLLFNESVVINIRHKDATQSNGCGKLVNEINVIKPGASIKIESDYGNDHKKFLLDAILKKQDDGGESKPMDLEEDEKDGLDKATGAYFLIRVVPSENSGRDWTNARWGCPDLFCRTRDANEAMKTYDVSTLRPVFGSRWNGERRRGGFNPFSQMRRRPWPVSQNVGDGFRSNNAVSATSLQTQGFSFGGGFSAPTFGVESPPSQNQADGFVTGGYTPAFSAVEEAAEENARTPPSSPGYGVPSPSYSPLQSPWGIQLTEGTDAAFVASQNNPFEEEQEEQEEQRGMSFNALNGSHAARVRYGDQIRVESQKVGMSFAYKNGSPMCLLGLSVLKEGVSVLPQLSKAESFSLALKMVEDCVNTKNRNMLNTLDKIYKEPTCLICLENPTSVIFIKCGHQATCETCSEKLEKKQCPVCRGNIVAKLHTVPDKQK